MTAEMLCIACRPSDDTPLVRAIGLDKIEPTHCYGTGDRPPLPSVLGGNRCPCPCRTWDQEPTP